MTARTPDWLVERLHADDLPAPEAARVRARLAAEGGLGRLDALRADDAAFREAHPPGPALARIRPGMLPRAAPRWRVVLPAVAAVAASLAVALLVPRRLDDGTRLKGTTPHLEIHRQRSGDAPEALAAGAAVRAGDLLQLSYVAGDAAYGAVVSVDGRGAVTLHLPEGGGPAAPLRRGGVTALPSAYQLDDAPGFERFFLVTGSAPFDSAVAVDAARRVAALGSAETAALDLPRGLKQHALMLRKR